MPRVNMNDSVDRMFLQYLDRLNDTTQTRNRWRQVRDNPPAGGAAHPLWEGTEVLLQLDPELLYVMASLHMMDSEGAVTEFSDALTTVARDFAGVEADADTGTERIMPADRAAAVKQRMISRFFDFLADTRLENLSGTSETDVEKFFMINQAFQHANTLMMAYGDLYREWVRRNPAKEELLTLRMRQAEAMGEQMQIAVNAYYTERSRTQFVPNAFESSFFGEEYTGSDTIAAAGEEISSQLAHKHAEQMAGRSVEAGVNLHVSPAFKRLGDMTDDELIRVTRVECDLAKDTLNRIFTIMVPEEMAEGGVLRAGGTTQKMGKEDLVFINGQSLREYTLGHLPANMRTDANVAEFSGLILARAMQEGTNRISCAQVQFTSDGGYDVTLHPVNLDLRDCQPDIEDDLSYGWIHRKIFNWGPFKCKTRQEKANEAYRDPKLQRLEEGIKERLSGEIRTGRENQQLLSALDRLSNTVQETGAYIQSVQNDLGMANQDADPRDLYSLANVLMADSLNLPPSRQSRIFTDQMHQLVRAFYSLNVGAREYYLDKMADFIDNFDPSRLDLKDPNDLFRLGAYCRMSQTLEVKAKDYPEWFYRRYPTEADRERYHLNESKSHIYGAYWQKKGLELTGRHIMFSGFWNLDENDLEALKDFSAQIMRPDRAATLTLKVPQGAGAYMNASVGELESYPDLPEQMSQYVNGLLMAATPSPESRQLLGSKLEDVFYVDGVSLKEYASRFTQNRSTFFYEKLFMHVLADGGHHIEMVSLRPDRDNKWALDVKPVQLDLSACEAVRSDNYLNTERADETFRFDEYRESRTDTIREGLRERLTRGAAAENRKRQQAGLPLMQLENTVLIRLDDPAPTETRTTDPTPAPAPVQTETRTTDPTPAPAPVRPGNGQPQTRPRSNSVRVAKSFNAIVEEEGAAGENKPKPDKHQRRNSMTGKPASEMNRKSKQ